MFRHTKQPSKQESKRSEMQVITPWDVTGGTDGKIDYDKLIREVHAMSALPAWMCSNCLHNTDPFVAVWSQRYRRRPGSAVSCLCLL